MEIKHTLEILTKDIQDIEKLVANLQNSKDGSSIELDLAMSKLRNVYEILTMIKADRLSDLISPEPPPQPDAAAGAETAAEHETEQKAETAPTPDTEPKAEAEPAAAADTATGAQPEPGKGPPDKKEAGILAEKFSAESSINENMAGQRGKDMDTKLTGQPIDNISRNIGINDRFLIIRELFNGDADRFSTLVSSLESAGSYREASNLLTEQFQDSMEHEGVLILSGLVKRRFSGN